MERKRRVNPPFLFHPLKTTKTTDFVQVEQNKPGGIRVWHERQNLSQTTDRLFVKLR